jgi:hypothetical protein
MPADQGRAEYIEAWPASSIGRKPATARLVADGVMTNNSGILGYIGQVITLWVPLKGYDDGTAGLMHPLDKKSS